MKKISNFKIFTAALVLSVLSSSCDKYLDTVPDNRIILDTPEKIGEMLTSAYPKGNYAPFCEIMSDNVSDNFNDTSVPPTYSRPYFWQDVLELDQDTPQNYWESCYTAIAACNNALQAIEKLGGGDQLNAYKGEALVARAYAHFMLVTLFSKFYDATTAVNDPGIPYVKTPETTLLPSYDRRTVEATYADIEADLLQGIPLIDDNVYKVPSYHFTKNAAYAFASRFYLYKKNYDKVIEYANLVAGTSGFAPNMRDWTNNYGNKSFVVVRSEYSRASEKSNLLLANTTSFWSRYWAGFRYGLSSNLGRDLYFSAQPGGGALNYSLFGSERGVYLPKFDELFVRQSPSANTGLGYIMMTLFSTEEVLFNRAEALLYKGNGTAALADINTFLSLRIENYNPANHTLTTAKLATAFPTQNAANALLNLVIGYRRLEFMHEGMRWFDLLRYKVPVTHDSFNRTNSQTLTANDRRRVLQIPQEAVLAGLQQNPR
jgi:starch-binding outer membrane protein, SusD/RagB family